MSLKNLQILNSTVNEILSTRNECKEKPHRYKHLYLSSPTNSTPNHLHQKNSEITAKNPPIMATVNMTESKQQKDRFECTKEANTSKNRDN